MGKQGAIRIGVGGWTFEPWRGHFYPEGLVQKNELAFMAGRLSSIEINATYYGSQKPASFRKWREETPDDFVFAVKGPRFATNRRVLGEARESIERFFASGVLELGDKLGPVNWQFAESKRFDTADFAAFLDLLPKTIEGRRIRHAVEPRHASFQSAAFVALARKHDVAVVCAGDSDFPQIADATADFCYLRVMGTKETPKQGYAGKALDLWADRAKALAAGKPAAGLETFGPAAPAQARDVFFYVISGFKANNPAAAEALIGRLKE